MKTVNTEVESEEQTEPVKFSDLVDNMIAIGKKLNPNKTCVCKVCGQPDIPNALKKYHRCSLEKKTYYRPQRSMKRNGDVIVKPARQLTVFGRKTLTA